MTYCHICRSDDLRTFLSLGPTPLANSYLEKDQLNETEPYYPLDVCFCKHCGLVQLVDVIPAEILFKKYAYMTGMSETMKEHFPLMAEQVMANFKPPPGSLIVDIGSNDGTLLRGFDKYNVNTLGIEPASNIAALSNAQGIETINDFFDEKLAQKVCEQRNKASVILSTNVFAHVNDLEDFLRGVSYLLAQDGVFIIEVPYLVDMLEKLEFDTIYHEHIRYYAVRPLVTLFSRFGMEIVHIERVSVHGGSIRVYVQKSGIVPSPSVKQLLELEESKKLGSFQTYQKFALAVSSVKEKLLSLLGYLKEKGSRIIGYGAPAKGSTLLNYCKIGNETLDYIIDVTPFKQNRYTPGMHIPIFSESNFHATPPDYALLLAWNYAEEILRKEDLFRKAGGKFILPIPDPRVV
ncbi:class I SAM-dependent methyltransferase [Chloroflexota bacterium]